MILTTLILGGLGLLAWLIWYAYKDIDVDE